MILREGPGLGVHLITWCDTVNNLNRYFTHQIAPRVRDAGALPDEPDRLRPPARRPHASKLGPHRALFASEEQNRLEKFRPYGIPSDEWLLWLSKQLMQRQVPAGPASR